MSIALSSLSNVATRATLGQIPHMIPSLPSRSNFSWKDCVMIAAEGLTGGAIYLAYASANNLLLGGLCLIEGALFLGHYSFRHSYASLQEVAIDIQQTALRANEAILSLQGQVNNLGENEAQLRVDIQAITNEKETLKENVQKLETAEKTINAEVQKLHEIKLTLTNLIEDQANKLAIFRDALLSLKDENKILKTTLIDLEGNITSLEGVDSHILETLKNCKSTFDSKEIELNKFLAEAQKTQDTLFQHLGNEEAREKEEEKELEADLAQMKATTENLSLTKEGLTQLIEQVKKEKLELQALFDKLFLIKDEITKERTSLEALKSLKPEENKV